MKKNTLRALALLPVVLAVFAGLFYLAFDIYRHGNEWIKYHPLNQKTVVVDKKEETVKLPPGNIYDRNGKTLLNTDDNKFSYNDDYNIRLSTLHIVGDPQGNISTGAKTVFTDILTGYSFAEGLYNLKEYGRGNDIYLTVNADACAQAYKALGKYKGAVGVYNYKTGELLCAVSKPSFDVRDIPDDILTNSKYEGVYVNRLFSSKYTPGSTFKIVTALAAIENVSDIYSRSFTCRGKLSYGTGTVICHEEDGHGIISFEEAMSKSCNCAFAQISELVGKEALSKTAEKLGFNQNFYIDSIKTSASKFSLDGANKSDLAWAGIGQYETGVSPIHMMMLAGAIANNGTGITPYLLSHAVSPDNRTTYSASETSLSFTVNPDSAAQLQQLMRNTVVKTYSDERFPGLTMCGKTGTAEYEGQDDYSWFVGFNQSEDAPYAIAVVAEQGGSGASTAINVANKTLQTLIKQ